MTAEKGSRENQWRRQMQEMGAENVRQRFSPKAPHFHSGWATTHWSNGWATRQPKGFL